MPIFFHDFELDVERYLLMEGGRAIGLRPKAFDLLAYLVTYRARVVRRAQLVAAACQLRSGNAQVALETLEGMALSKPGAEARASMFSRDWQPARST